MSSEWERPWFSDSPPTGPGAIDWPDIIPLETTDLLPFPVSKLGPDLAPFVTSLSDGLQTPPDLAGTMTLGAISAAAGGRYLVQPEPGWTELVTLHTACFLPSGNRKSAVVRAISAPFEVEQANRSVSERADRARWETRRKIEEKAHQRLIDKAGDKGDQTTALLAEESAIRLAADRPPKITRYLVDDVTPERLTQIMFEQGGAIAVMSAEAGFFTSIGGRYSDSPQLEALLCGYAGDPLNVSRVGRADEYIQFPSLTLAIAPQPSVISDLAKMAGYLGRGGAARKLPRLPHSPLGHRSSTPPAMPSTLQDGYGRLITALLRRQPAATPLPGGHPRPAIIIMDRNARERLRDFQDAIEPRLGDDGDLADLTDWGGKLAGNAARIAALLHIAQHAHVGEPASVPIIEDTMDRAIAIAESFIPHAIRFYELLTNGEVGTGPAREVLTAVLSLAPRTTKRDLFQRLRKRQRFAKTGSLNEPLALLEECGYIRIERQIAGGRPSDVITVNPEAQKAHSWGHRAEEPGYEPFEPVFVGHHSRNQPSDHQTETTPEMTPEQAQKAQYPSDGDDWEVF